MASKKKAHVPALTATFLIYLSEVEPKPTRHEPWNRSEVTHERICNSA